MDGLDIGMSKNNTEHQILRDGQININWYTFYFAISRLFDREYPLLRKKYLKIRLELFHRPLPVLLPQ
jgi:hypothetical protein